MRYSLTVTPTAFEQMYLHNNWANLRLLEVCEKLTDEQLDREFEGTYGSIRNTLRHIAAAQERYVFRLDPDWTSTGLGDKEASFPELLKSIEASGARLLEVAPTIPDGATYESKFGEKPYRVNSAIVLVQSIHHANDHRTQIATMLSLQGIEPPVLDSWEYGDSTGQIVSLS